jgi:four helix bundle protein
VEDGMRDYKELDVWKKSHEYVLQVYRCTKGFPDDERYGLSSQMRKAAVSMPANTAEGIGRDNPGDLLRFLSIAQGSAFESEYYVILSGDLGCLAPEDKQELRRSIDRIRKMLFAFARRITARRNK